MLTYCTSTVVYNLTNSFIPKLKTIQIYQYRRAIGGRSHRLPTPQTVHTSLLHPSTTQSDCGTQQRDSQLASRSVGIATRSTPSHSHQTERASSQARPTTPSDSGMRRRTRPSGRLLPATKAPSTLSHSPPTASSSHPARATGQSVYGRPGQAMRRESHFADTPT